MTPEYLNVFKYLHEVHTRVNRQSLDRTLFLLPEDARNILNDLLFYRVVHSGII